MNKGKPGDDDHLENLAEYISDERKLMICGNGVDYLDAARAVNQMMWVKSYYGKTRNCALVQLIVSYTNPAINADDACEMTREIAGYFNGSNQTLYCVHEKDNQCSNYHAHILVNPVNLNDGKIMQTDTVSMRPFCDHVADVTGTNYRLKYKGKRCSSGGSGEHLDMNDT